MTSSEIRKQFIDFFAQRHAHAFVPSSPVVPHDDPTLLFTNAGMNQFKPIFLGQERRAYTRAVNTQKCIRAGGKHNDLDDVGRSRRHHTFFEMLGNWSFGDYFKQGAIEMSWQLLTKVWKLDPTRIHVSCYEGDPKANIPRDTEAADIWRKVANWEQYGLRSDDHIHYFGADNFWAMGDTGPCGPCTEIYYDRTPDKTGGPQVNGDDPRVMEIWNNVFIQFDRDTTGKLTPLPAQHVDTGMGLERICQVLQDKQDNFAIDLWQPIFDALTELSGITYAGRFPKSNTADPVAEAADAQLRHDIAFRVVADHVRCLTFALTDGAVPSNEGRGYVLRRILRRAVRFGRQQLGLAEPFLHKLVPVVVDSMSDAFPELRTNTKHVIELIKDEEVSFGKTWDRGIQLFNDAATHALERFAHGSQLREQHPEMSPDAIWDRILRWPQADVRDWVGASTGTPTIDAEDAFKLHDTYGFPIDLTRIMAEDRGLRVDLAGYEQLMEEARERARAPKDGVVRLKNLVAVVEDTDEAPKYQCADVETVITAIVTQDYAVETGLGKTVDRPIGILIRRTPFYADQGGQMGDTGVIESSAATFEVEQTVRQWNNVLHLGHLKRGVLTVGDRVVARVNRTARAETEKNHTSTHLTNWALREVLGEGVQQKGSLVDPDKLRFDFSHAKSLSDDELGKIEQLVGQCIERKLPVYAETVPQEQALKINGLRAVFGEKYPPMVRVVSVGAPVQDLVKNPTDARWRQFSVEFCGGTHLGNAADAQAFAIVGEESVSKGVRRLVALTGDAAKAANETARGLDAMTENAQSLRDDQLGPAIATLQKAASAPGLPLRAKRRTQIAVGELQARQKAFEKSSAKAAATGPSVDATAAAGELLASAPALGGGRLVVGEVAGASDDQLRGAMDSVKKKAGSYAVLLGAATDGKVTFVAAVSDDLIAKGLKAGDWVREAAKTAGGGGGGRPQMAQAGGKDPAKLAEALDVARSYATRTVTE